MKLPQFLKKIDTFSSSMSRDQLERLLHEIARTAPEKEREKLLSLFTAFAVEDTDSSRGGTDEGGDGHSFNHSFDDDKNQEIKALFSFDLKEVITKKIKMIILYY